MATWTRLDVVRRLAAASLGDVNAARHSLGSFEWDISGDCQEPVPRELYGRADCDRQVSTPKTRRRKLNSLLAEIERHFPGARVVRSENWNARENARSNWTAGGPGKKASMTMLLHVRCRKCDNCRKLRARVWAARARSEIAQAPRTWMCSFTLRPEEHSRDLLICQRRAAKSGVDFDALAYGEQFIRRAQEGAQRLTRFWKRLRKSGAKFRYVMVAEAHQSGLPHWHALVHEIVDEDHVKWDDLADHWNDGFAVFKLVRESQKDFGKAAWYVAKYLTKSAAARVRASARYGQTRELPTKKSSEAAPTDPSRSGEEKRGLDIPVETRPEKEVTQCL